MGRIISGILWFCSGANFQLTRIIISLQNVNRKDESNEKNAKFTQTFRLIHLPYIS